MIDGFSDPYEQADGQRFDEAKLVTPQPAKKNRKILVAGMVLAGLILGVVILANVAGLIANRATPDARKSTKPVTMTKQQGESFAQQQSGQADYMKGADRDKKLQSNEDTILGRGAGLAADAYEEVDGVPKKTKAQDDAERGQSSGRQAGVKSEAQQLQERAALEAQHRRQNDLDSSPVSVDFSDYFEKQKPTSAAPAAANPDSEAVAMEARAAAVVQRHHALADAERSAGDSEEAEPELASLRKGAHDPHEDFTFDSASGKLYRLMEDTIIETVLVNRLSGAAIGPVITMVTADVYSESGRLLIPKGTRFLGRVSSVSSVNQERLFVAFHRMIMPDGYSVSLDKFQGLDVVGQTGLRDLVDHHYVRIFGASLALAAVAATAQIGNTGASYGSYDFGVSMRNGASQQLGQSAQRIMERFINTLPTFTIRERARVKIVLSSDLLLPDTKNHTMDPDL